MKHIIVLLLLVFVYGCSPIGDERQSTKEVLTCDEQEKRSDFILQCIKNANPKSDEEPEDWLRICQRMGNETWCKSEIVVISQTCAYGRGLNTCFEWVETKKINNNGEGVDSLPDDKE